MQFKDAKGSAALPFGKLLGNRCSQVVISIKALESHTPEMPWGRAPVSQPRETAQVVRAGREGEMLGFPLGQAAPSFLESLHGPLSWTNKPEDCSRMPARVSAGPKRPDLGVCPGPNIPLQGRQGSRGCAVLYAAQAQAFANEDKPPKLYPAVNLP